MTSASTERFSRELRDNAPTLSAIWDSSSGRQSARGHSRGLWTPRHRRVGPISCRLQLPSAIAIRVDIEHAGGHMVGCENVGKLTRYLMSSLSVGLTAFHPSPPVQKMRYESSAYGPQPGMWEIGVGGYGTVLNLTASSPVKKSAVVEPRDGRGRSATGGSERKT